MTQLVLISLAAFWAWEYLLTLSPWTLPAWLQPPLVIGLAVGACYLPGRVLLVVAVGGSVALLHQLLVLADVILTTRQIRRIPHI